MQGRSIGPLHRCGNPDTEEEEESEHGEANEGEVLVLTDSESDEEQDVCNHHQRRRNELQQHCNFKLNCNFQ